MLLRSAQAANHDTEVTPIGSATPNRQSVFFAAGFEPAQKGNKSALAAAERRAWPVLLTWTHFDESGAVQGSAGWLSCSKTTDSKQVTDESAANAIVLVETAVSIVFLIWVAIMHLLCGFC